MIIMRRSCSLDYDNNLTFHKLPRRPHSDLGRQVKQRSSGMTDCSYRACYLACQFRKAITQNLFVIMFDITWCQKHWLLLLSCLWDTLSFEVKMANNKNGCLLQGCNHFLNPQGWVFSEWFTSALTEIIINIFICERCRSQWHSDKQFSVFQPIVLVSQWITSQSS